MNSPRTAAAMAAKGALQPHDPSVHVDRALVHARYVEVARQVWLPRWAVPAGRTLTQPVLQYPAVNVVVEPGDAAMYLPADGLGSRALNGTSWAAGVLLRPGAGSLVVPGEHSTMLGARFPIPRSDRLVDALRTVTPAGTVDDVRHAYQEWLEPLLDLVDDELRLVNAICDAAENEGGITSVRDLATRFDVTERTLQRLLRRRVGLSPRWLIQRRRLQEAAYLVREEPHRSLAQVAADLGYSDQAHFSRDLRAVVGQTPGDYRRSSRSTGR